MKAKAAKYVIIALLIASLFIVTTTFVNAEPVIDKVNGTWSDSFSEPNATAGIASSTNVTVSDGNVKLSRIDVISEHSFETVTDWIYSETDNKFNGAKSTTWKTDGTYSYRFSSTQNIPSGEHSQILQSVDFTNMDTITFDANLWQETAGKFEAQVLVDSTIVWSNEPPTTATECLNESINVSSYTGTHNLIFRIETRERTLNKDQTNYFDNIRTNYYSSASLTSTPITLSSLAGWDKFYANDTINATQGTNITYKILNAADNSTLCTITSTQANAGYDISSNASGVSSIRLYADLTTSDTAYTPALHGWNVSWTPMSITNLQNTTGNFWINWTWDNPPDADFNHTMVFINGTWQTNVSKPLNYYNATYTPHATKTISTHTVDTSGNISEKWVNQTTTIPNNNPVLELIGVQEVNETEALTIDVNATDLDDDTLTYSCNRTDLFADFNTTTGKGSWIPSKGKAGIYYVDFGVYDGYGGVYNETVKITVVDTIPPDIINVTATNIMDISAVITWNTDEISDSTVKYGTEPGNYTRTASNPTFVLNHSVALIDLLGNTTYYYVVNSTDKNGNSKESSEYNFTTLTLCLSLSAYPQSIEVGGNSSVISANVTYNNRQPCKRGVNVSFTTTLGYFNGTENTTWRITNTTGIANVTLISPDKAGKATITATVVNTSVSDTTTVTFTPGPPAILLLDANPQKPFANGIDISTVTATVKDEFGNPISGKEVTFSALEGTKTRLTNMSGQVSVELRATLKIQNVTVNASTNGLTNSTVVSFVAGDPHDLIVNANPTVIAVLDIPFAVNKSTITALVVDEWYHALKGWEVNFTKIGGGTLTPDNATTNTLGKATATLYSSDTAETVTVTATINNLTDSTAVNFTDLPFLNITTFIDPETVIDLPEYVNVTHIIIGEGPVIPKPVDVMHVMDRSGSMCWYGDVIHNNSGSLTSGWTKIDTFNIDPSIITFDVLLETGSGSRTTQYLRIKSPSGVWYGYSHTPDYYPLDYIHNTYHKYFAGADYIALYQSGSVESGTWEVYAKGSVPYVLAVQVPPIRIDAAKDAAKTFVGLMSAQGQLGVVSFSSSATRDEQLTLLDTQAEKDFVNDSIDSLSAFGYTAIGDGIHEAKGELTSIRSRDEAIKAMVLLSDGISNTGSDPRIRTQEAADEGIKIFTIGFGEADYELLQDIANITGGKYYYAADVTELQEIYTEVYEEIAAIAEQAQVNVKLPGVNVSGVVIPNATYVNNSVNTTFTPKDEPSKNISSEPTTTSSGNNQILTFDIRETIRIGDTIRISYRLFVNGTGTIIAGDSTVEAGTYTQNFGPVTGPTITGTGGGIGNDPPVAIINANDKVYVNEPIQFDGSGSSDDGTIANYTWDFNASDGIQEDATGINATHNYSAEGIYTVTLTVTDDEGKTSATTTTVTVFNMTISMSRPWIMIQGQGVDTALITVNATRDNGIAVDGVPINFNTSLGTLNPGTRTTGDDGAGLAMVTLTSGDTAGHATIKATEQYSYAFVTIDVEIRSRGEITLE